MHSARIVRPPESRDLVAALEVVTQALSPTPMIPVSMRGQQAWLKLETLQPTGSFKVRGALAAPCPASHLWQTSWPCRRATMRSGCSWASGGLGVPATVVLAETASPAKLPPCAGFRSTW